MLVRNRTPSKHVYYGLYLYFSGLSLRRTSERLSVLAKRNHVSIWNWIQKYHPKKLSSKRKKISEFVVDETLIKVGSEHIWRWVAIEPKDREILALIISKGRNTFVAERFIAGLAKTHGKYAASADKGTWYPQACRFLNMEHHIHSPMGKESWKGRCNTSRAGQKDLMIASHAE